MELTPAQSQIVTSRARFRVVNCGRRFGKTTLSVIEMVALATLSNDKKIAYIAPSFDQARDIAWETLKKTLAPLDCSINESRLEIIVPTQLGGTSKIILRGWEAIERLRGQSFDLIVLDEVASMRKFYVGWEEVLFPTLTDRIGQALFISTPKGFNHFWELFEMEKKDKDYKSFHYTTFDNPFIPKTEVEKARETLPHNRFEQEYLAEFRKMQGLIWNITDDNIYHEHSAIVNKQLQFPDNIIAGLDWGFQHPAGIAIVKIKDGSYYLIDEWRGSGKVESEIFTQAKIFQEKYNINLWYPDPADASKIESMKREGFVCGLTNKDVILGLSKVASLFKEHRLFISSNCQQFLGEAEQYIWYEPPHGGISVKERPVKENDDLCDALRYAIMGWQVREPKALPSVLQMRNERFKKLLLPTEYLQTQKKKQYNFD